MVALTGVIDQLIRELLGSTRELAPYESDKRALWAVERAWVAALGPGGTTEVLAAMPDVSDEDARVDFLRGLVAGAGSSVSAFVKEQVEGVAAAVKGLLAYYGLVYDADMWVQMLKVWTSEPGTSVEVFERYLATRYPDLYTTVRAFQPFVAELNAFAARLRDTTTPPGEEWRVCERLVAEWLGTVPVWLGGQLRPHVDAFVAATGDAREQGVVVGRVGGRVIIEVVLMAVSIDDIARTARGVDKLDGHVRKSLNAQERKSVGDKVAASSPGLPSAAADAAQAQRVAQRLNEEAVGKIEAYTTLSRKTRAFNKHVKDLYGLTASSAEYVSIRLDAHHIVKASLYKEFAGEFRRVFGWKSSGDMDCIGLPHMYHSRDGSKLATELGLLGAEEVKSLTQEMERFMARWQREKGKFRDLEDVFVAHEAFYKTEAPLLYVDLEKWFTKSLATIRNGG